LHIETVGGSRVQPSGYKRMLTHDQIWFAIDTLAANNGLTPSSLAKLAGLSTTAFNRSKRVSSDGNPRWPSTESIAKILAATHVSVDDFLALIRPVQKPDATMLPFRVFDGEAVRAFDSTGEINKALWDHITVPGTEANGAFALGIRGDAFYPHYKDGDILIASQEAPRRKGDKVVVAGHDQTLVIAVLGPITASHLHLETLDGVQLQPRRHANIRMVARILWVSQ